MNKNVRVEKAFEAIIELQDQVDAKKEAIKDMKGSINDFLKTIAQELDIENKSAKKAYKEYLFEKENPIIADEANTVLVMLKE